MAKFTTMQALKAVMPTGGTMPILRRILVKDNVAMASDLDVAVRIPHEAEDGIYQVVGTQIVKDPKREGIDDYPEILELYGKPVTKITLNIREELKQVLPFVSVDPLKPALVGVLLKIENGRAYFVTTDGHRMAVRSKGVRKNMKDASYIIPTKFIKVLLRNELDEITLNFNRRQKGDTDRFLVWADNGKMILSAACIWEDYPDYPSVVPEKVFGAMEFSRKEMSDALTNTLPFTDKQTRKIALVELGDKLYVKAEDHERGFVDDKARVVEVNATPVEEGNELNSPIDARTCTNLNLLMPVREETDSEKVFGAFNGQYFQHFMKALTADRVRLHRTSKKRPGIGPYLIEECE